MTRRINPKAGEASARNYPWLPRLEKPRHDRAPFSTAKSASAVPHENLIVEDLVETDPNRKIRIEALKLVRRHGRKDVRFRGEEYVC
jgi:hypothetical protein